MKMKNLHGRTDDMENRICNLKFDKHTYNFVSLLDDFRLKELYCDATIACDGKNYPVHQVVLSACSDFFANIFANDTCQNPLIVLQDINHSHLECLLNYIYRGEANIPQCDLQDFMKVAKSLFIKGLMIPQLEKLATSDAIGTWHEPYFGPDEGVTQLPARKNGPPPMELVDAEGQFHHGPIIQQHRDVRIHHRHLSIQMPVPRNGLRVNENDIRRQNSTDPREHFRVPSGERPQKRPHYMVEIPQDLSIPQGFNLEKPVGINIHRENYNQQSRNDNGWDGEESERVATKASVVPEPKPDNDACQERKRQNSMERKDQLDDKETTLKSYSMSSDSHGTFQTLIGADEITVKQEPPEEELTNCDIKEDLGNDYATNGVDDDEEEAPLHILEEDDLADEPESDMRYSSPASDSTDNSCLQISEAYMRHSDSGLSLSGHLSPNSQLRRELLRPVPHSVGLLPERSQVFPQSIPHPVIASRESQVQLKSQSQLTLRQPPPLMKITEKNPILIGGRSESNISRPRSSVSDVPVSRGNSHLLVSAPPTYRSHNSSHNVCFEIHNQHLGPILVNGGSHMSFNQPKLQINRNFNNSNDKINSISHLSYDNEGPLNLSGFQRSTSQSPEYQAEGDRFLGKIMTNRKKRLRGPKSWEYLVRLLKDPTTNPNLIRWENESHGIFRLVQPSVIAQKWGRRTGKHASENLSYENFARGLRYHYATGALKPVSEKSFVYRFGPKAIKLIEECDSTTFPYI